MKTKITKIWGVGLTLALLASLLLGAVPASAGTLAWSEVSTPNPISNQIMGGTDVDMLAIAPDGSTMFAYCNNQSEALKLVVTEAVVGATADVTITYIDQDGNAAEAAAASTDVTVAAGIIGYEIDVALNGADTGARDVTAIAITNATTDGTIEIRGGTAGGSTGLLFGSIDLSKGAASALAGGKDLLAKLYKSTSAGVKWTSTNIGAEVEGLDLVIWLYHPTTLMTALLLLLLLPRSTAQ